VDDLLQRCRNAESMDFSRRRRGGLGIVAYNAALNTFCELGCGLSLCPFLLSFPRATRARDVGAGPWSRAAPWACGLHRNPNSRQSSELCLLWLVFRGLAVAVQGVCSQA
jgi:hypothetical protein